MLTIYSYTMGNELHESWRNNPGNENKTTAEQNQSERDAQGTWKAGISSNSLAKSSEAASKSMKSTKVQTLSAVMAHMACSWCLT